jgi:voltage-gated potassium channel
MKFLAPQIAAFVRNKTTRRNFKLLLRYVALLFAMTTLYAVLFHVIMEWEGKDHSWVTGFYWTFTVMTTLGFGDITFTSDLGRIFSMLVMMSGVVFLLIVFPFTFIHFFYQPWLQTQDRLRTPRELPADTRDHFLLVGDDPVVMALVHRIRALDKACVLMVPDPARALELAEEGVSVMVGVPDDPAAWQKARVTKAHAVIACADDYLNTNIAFTVRELTATVRIAALARSVDSVDVLQLAGANYVVNLTSILGTALARRAYGGGARANPIGSVDGLFLAEAPMMHANFVGRRLGELDIGATTGVHVVGVWDHGVFALPNRNVPIAHDTVLVLAGPEANLARFDAMAGGRASDRAPVLILGAGRVGRVVAQELARRGLDYRIVDLNRERANGCDPERFIAGSAADLATLERAGIRETPTVIITPRDDATNVYLTVYCRRLRPDVQIIARASLEKNISTMHRAGASLVMSYSSLGATALLGYTEEGSALHVAEGLEIFRCRVPPDFPPQTLRESRLREDVQCSVVSIERGGERLLAPRSGTRLEPGDKLIVVGTPDGRRALEARLNSEETPVVVTADEGDA